MAPRSIRRRAACNAKPEENKQQLVNMPLDVLIEIFLLLEPLDLLHLARTTKGLRAFLLSHNKCSCLWKSAISNVDGLPACPDHISAPAYTHLAFVPVCHGCFGPCETIEWELRMRCCSTCWEGTTIRPPRFVYRSLYANLYDVKLPTTSTHFELDFATDNTFPSDLAVKFTSNSFPAVCSRLDLKTAKSRKRPKEVPMDEFVAEQNKFWDSILKHARLCQIWDVRRLKAKAVQLSSARKQRRLDIEHKLLKSGRPIKQMFLLPDFWRLPEVIKPEPLTPTEWAEIRPRLVSWLEKAEEESIWHHHINICKFQIDNIQEELIKDPTVKVKPETIDIAMLPVVRSMLERNVHSDLTLVDEMPIFRIKDDATKIFSRVVTQAIRKWSSDAVEELESFARERLNLPHSSKPSRLPSVIFRCKQCNERLAFDKALSHQHLYRERCNDKRNTSDMSIYDRLLATQEHHNRLPRDISVLQIDVRASRRVENLIRRMGKNPNRVIYGEMCRSSVKVACGLCRSQTTMDFRSAFDHCLIAHFRKKESGIWTRISARKIAEMSNDK